MVKRRYVLLICLAFGVSTFTIASAQTTEKSDAPSAAKETVPVEKAEPDSKKSKLASQDLLPASTKAWFSVPDIKILQDQFKETQFGKLTQDEALKPFIESLDDQFKSWIDDKNMRLGLKIEDLEPVRTGEICLAGVLPGGIKDAPEKMGRGAHGLVLLVDVSGQEDKTLELMKRINDDLEKRKAKRFDIPEMHGVKVTKWVFPKPEQNRLRKSRESFHAIVNGWLLAADNENIFREVVLRYVKTDQSAKAGTLAGQDAFKAVMNNTNLGGNDGHFSWYIEPFGYIELAQAIEAEKDTIKQQNKTDKARSLKQQGFDAIRGIGGKISFATGSHEMLHQTFVFMPKVKGNVNQKRVFGLMDFANVDNDPMAPEQFVPAEISGYVTGNWDMDKAFNNAGGVVDALFGDGTFINVIDGLKKDPVVHVDLPWMVKQLGRRITIFSETNQIEIKPGEDEIENPEQVAFCLSVTGDHKELFASIIRALGKENVESFKLAGHPADVVLNDTTLAENSDDGGGDNPLLIEGLDDEDDEQKEVEQFELFEKRYITLFKGTPGKEIDAEGPTYIIIANNKDFLKKIVLEKVDSQLSVATDYVQINEALGDFVDAKNVVWKNFGRVDKAFAANYQLLRHNKMAQANTVLARVLNEFMKPQEENEVPREQKIDGSKLPADYENRVAPYFGPMGWAMESSDEGLRVTGVMLKKNKVSEIVRKPGDDDPSRR